MSRVPARPTIVHMAQALFTAAATSWPDAAIAIAGVALVGTIAVVVVWQALATWRTRISVSREAAYRKLAEQIADDLHDINERVLDIAQKLGAEERGR
jgi:hypothetical protein